MEPREFWPQGWLFWGVGEVQLWGVSGSKISEKKTTKKAAPEVSGVDEPGRLDPWHSP